MKTKAYRSVLLATCATLGIPASAGASTLEVFTISATYLGGSLSGTFDYNGGVFSAIDITATGWPGSPSKTDIFDTNNVSTSTSIQLLSSGDSLARLTLLPLVSLASISPGGSTTLGTGSLICLSGGSGTCNEFPVGSLTASVATTPLPASLPLFFSGLSAMGLFRWLRKRAS
jgi:hypothetical protein